MGGVRRPPPRRTPAMRATLPLAACLCLAAASGGLRPPLAQAADDRKKPSEQIKEVAGTAEFLRRVPKHFATLKAVDPARRRVTLLIEGETLAKVWPLAPDAEMKVLGWWGRLDQFKVGDRVWVWFKTDRQKQPVAVAMLADEPSEQDMHGPGVTVEAADAKGLTVKPVKGASRKLASSAGAAKVGSHVYVQSAGGKVRLLLTPEEFEARRTEQRAALRKRWADEGLPGQVAFAHTFSGELDFLLDHEAMRWGRSLKYGDK